MIGTCTDDTNTDAVTLVPAGKAINDIDAVASVQVIDGTLTVDTPDLEERRRKLVRWRTSRTMQATSLACSCEWRGGNVAHGENAGCEVIAKWNINNLGIRPDALSHCHTSKARASGEHASAFLRCLELY